MHSVTAARADAQRQVDLGARADVHQPSGPTAAASASHSSMLSVCGRRSGAMPTVGQGGIETLAPNLRQLPRQHVVEHLASLAEAGLHEPPELLLVLRRQAAGNRSPDQQRRLDLRSRLECRRWNRARDAHLGVVLDEDRQVAHAARRRRDTLGHLALDHDDETLRPRLVTEQVVHHRAGDVVRQVGGHVERRHDQVVEWHVQHVRLHQAQVTVVDRLHEARLQMGRKALIDLDGGDEGALGQQRAGQHAKARPDLEDRLARLDGGQLDDVLDHLAVDEVVLAAALARREAVAAQVALDAFG